MMVRMYCAKVLINTLWELFIQCGSWGFIRAKVRKNTQLITCLWLKSLKGVTLRVGFAFYEVCKVELWSWGRCVGGCLLLNGVENKNACPVDG